MFPFCHNNKFAASPCSPLHIPLSLSLSLSLSLYLSISLSIYLREILCTASNGNLNRCATSCRGLKWCNIPVLDRIRAEFETVRWQPPAQSNPHLQQRAQNPPALPGPLCFCILISRHIAKWYAISPWPACWSSDLELPALHGHRHVPEKAILRVRPWAVTAEVTSCRTIMSAIKLGSGTQNKNTLWRTSAHQNTAAFWDVTTWQKLPDFLVLCLTFEDGTDGLSRNVCGHYNDMRCNIIEERRSGRDEAMLEWYW